MFTWFTEVPTSCKRAQRPRPCGPARLRSWSVERAAAIRTVRGRGIRLRSLRGGTPSWLLPDAGSRNSSGECRRRRACCATGRAETARRHFSIAWRRRRGRSVCGWRNCRWTRSGIGSGSPWSSGSGPARPIHGSPEARSGHWAPLPIRAFAHGTSSACLPPGWTPRRRRS